MVLTGRTLSRLAALAIPIAVEPTVFVPVTPLIEHKEDSTW